MKRYIRNTILVLASVVSAMALAPRKARRFEAKESDISMVGATDASTLQYALTLEHLQATFYEEGIANFTQQQYVETGYDATFYRKLERVASDGAAYVSYIGNVLQNAGAVVPKRCSYRFPYSDPASFVALSVILEGVGVSRYSKVTSNLKGGNVIAAAPSGLAVETRPASYLRATDSQRSLDSNSNTRLDSNQIKTLAWPFFVNCPAGNPPMRLTAFPRLTIANSTGPWMAGNIIKLQTSNVVLADSQGDVGSAVYAAFVSASGPTFTETTKLAADTFSAIIPEGVEGQTYVILSSCRERVNDGTTVAGPAILEIVSA